MTKMYIVYLFVNKKLKISEGKSMSQSFHCAVELYKNLEEQDYRCKERFIKWSNEGHKTVVLTATENEMYCLEENFRSVKIYDAGRTEVESGTFTMLALYPNKFDKNEFTQFKLK